MTTPVVALDLGQLWRGQGINTATYEVIEMPEEEFLLKPVAVLMPVKVAKLRNLDKTMLGSPEIWVRQLDFGHQFLRIPEADEHYATAEEAKAALVDGWNRQCRRCGDWGARVVQAKDRLTLCHVHGAEWKLMNEQHDRERKAFYGR